MDDFDFNIDNFEPGARRKRVSERKVRRHDTPDPTPTHAFDQDEPRIETIRVVRDDNHDEPRRRTDSATHRPQSPRRHNTQPRSFFAPFMDRRLHIFLGVLAMVTGVVMAVVLFSHLRTAAADQSMVLNMSVKEMAQHPENVNNTGGAFGAWLSHALFADALGLGSFVVAIYLLVIGASLIVRLKINFWAFTFKSALLAIAISIITGLVTYEADSAVFWGGTHGHFANKFLFDNASIVGALAVSILLFAAVVCVFYHPICHFLKRAKAFVPPLHRPKYEDVPDTPVANKHDEPVSIPLDNDNPASTETSEPATQDSILEEVPVTPVAMTDPDEKKSDAFSMTDTSKPVHSAVAFAIDDIEEVDDIESTHDNAKQTTNTDAAPANDPQFTVKVATPDDSAPTTGSVAGPRPMSDGALDHRLTMPDYMMPTLDLLEERVPKRTIDMEEQQANKDRIVKTLADYGITVSKISATVGPTVTLFEIIPTEGTRISKIKNLEDDIAMALAARGIRIIAPIPGKGAVGIEVPNSEPQTVSMRHVLNSAKFRDSNKRLPVALGATISNEVFVADLAAMPHALVAGATGQGKSVGLNAIITSLLYKKHPTELKFVLIDPKMVEFSLYSKIEKHYLAKLPDEDEAIITDSNKVLNVLNSLCVEMDQRYEMLKNAGVRDIVEYNRKFTQGRLSTEDGHKFLPYIVVVIDEFADLIITGRKEIEPPVIRITQKGRSAGIHMIIATQRPSTNVLTGLIKANCPARIAFRVQQMVDSRCILDQPGANQLIGRGDMLYSSAGGAMERIQCAFISTDEVENVVDFIDRQRGVDTYILPDPLLATPVDGASGAQHDAVGGSIGVDPLLKDCAYFFVSQGFASKPSTSVLQRRFSIGYNRAGKIMDQLQAAGIVSAPHGPTRERSLLADAEMIESILGQLG